jgi:hypothetical protein
MIFIGIGSGKRGTTKSQVILRGTFYHLIGRTIFATEAGNFPVSKSARPVISFAKQGVQLLVLSV